MLSRLDRDSSIENFLSELNRCTRGDEGAVYISDKYRGYYPDLIKVTRSG